MQLVLTGTNYSIISVQLETIQTLLICYTELIQKTTGHTAKIKFLDFKLVINTKNKTKQKK